MFWLKKFMNVIFSFLPPSYLIFEELVCLVTDVSAQAEGIFLFPSLPDFSYSSKPDDLVPQEGCDSVETPRYSLLCSSLVSEGRELTFSKLSNVRTTALKRDVGILLVEWYSCSSPLTSGIKQRCYTLSSSTIISWDPGPHFADPRVFSSS